MARQKEPPKPMSALRHDFVASLENVCQQSLMLMQAVEMVIEKDSGIRPQIREMLSERAEALRAALLSNGE